jgi:glycosyl hydrolase family 16
MVSYNKIRVTIKRVTVNRLTINKAIFFPIVVWFFLLSVPGGYSQSPGPLMGVKLLGTRSWIKVSWQNKVSDNDDSLNVISRDDIRRTKTVLNKSIRNSAFRLYWSTENVRPSSPGLVVPATATCYYIHPVQEQTLYYVWIEGFSAGGVTQSASGSVLTTRNWSLDPQDAADLDIPSSQAVPEGMQLFWHDEFNDSLLNRNKWFTDYYSNLDFFDKVKYDELRKNKLPQAAYTLNGNVIRLFANDSLPTEDFTGGKKISSIQTYDWSTNENLLDNSRGGYFEVRVKRSFKGKPEGLNTAFWFDSPGSDLKYYLQDGTTVNGTRGIRPKGQLFEIDIFENLNAQFVMHGHVDTNGRFIHNLATDIAYGFEHKDQWVTHGILWTPTSIKHYINGRLIKAYDNKHQLFSPNHFMNILLGSYGKGGEVSMEVDYIRGYQWPVSRDNELPNGDFERNTTRDPWEGTGKLVKTAQQSEARSGKQVLLLEPGDSIEQYVYLNNNRDYELTYYAKGHAVLQAEMDNVEAVSGQLMPVSIHTSGHKKEFSPTSLHFKTGKMAGTDMKTVRIVFRNQGHANVLLDDVRVFVTGLNLTN